MKGPRILITNDDGIEAPGLRALYEAIAPRAEVAIVAPSSNCTGAGMSITLDEYMQIDPYDWGDGVSAWSVEGTPTDCVRVGLQFLLDYTPDLVLSGINWGSNAGRNAIYSGTVGAALEAGNHGVHGIALSVHYDEGDDLPEFSLAKHYVPSLLEFFLGSDYPSHVALNINFPSCPLSEVAGFRMARQGQSYWRILHSEVAAEERGQRVWAGGEHVPFEEEEGSDVLLLNDGYVVAVPLILPEMTHDEVRTSHGKSFESYFPTL